MANDGDLFVWSTSIVPNQGVWQNFTPADFYIQGRFGVGVTAVPTTRFKVSDTVASQTVESYFTATTTPRSGGFGWVINKPDKAAPVPQAIDWRVGDEPAWGQGMDYATANDDNDGFGDADFVLLYDYTANAQNQIVTVSTGGATSGNFKLTFTHPTGNTQTTGIIQWNATAADVHAALVALSNVGQDRLSRDNVSVTGNAGGPWTITFVHSLRLLDLGASPIAITANNLVGGTGATVTDVAEGSGGADIFRVSSTEVASPGKGPKFWMSYKAGSPRALPNCLTVEAGDGMGGALISYNADTSKQCLTLATRASDNNRVATYLTNTHDAFATWVYGMDLAQISGRINWAFSIYDGKTSSANKNRLYIEGTNNVSAKVGINTDAPVGIVHANADKGAGGNVVIETLFCGGYSLALNNRMPQLQQISDGSTVRNYLWLNGTLDSTSTLATPKANSQFASSFGVESTDSALSLISAVNGSAKTITRALTLDNAGKCTFSQDLTAQAALKHTGSSLGFYNATAISKPSVSGAKGGNLALGSLLSAPSSLGLITDNTSP